MRVIVRKVLVLGVLVWLLAGQAQAAGTNQQLYALSQGAQFQAAVSASIVKKAVAILDDVRQNGTVEAPLPTKTGNYTNAQRTRAFSIAMGQSLTPYILALACSTNVVASTLSVVNGQTVSDISDAALDSQVYTMVFQDMQ